VRSWAALALSSMGAATVPRLLEAVHNRNALIRRGAAHALSEIGPCPLPKSALPLVTKALKNHEPAVHSWAVRTLALMGLPA
jgi:HEAT repeat protein